MGEFRSWLETREEDEGERPRSDYSKQSSGFLAALKAGDPVGQDACSDWLEEQTSASRPYMQAKANALRRLVQACRTVHAMDGERLRRQGFDWAVAEGQRLGAAVQPDVQELLKSWAANLYAFAAGEWVAKAGFGKFANGDYDRLSTLLEPYAQGEDDEEESDLEWYRLRLSMMGIGYALDGYRWQDIVRCSNQLIERVRRIAGSGIQGTDAVMDALLAAGIGRWGLVAGFMGTAFKMNWGGGGS